MAKSRKNTNVNSAATAGFEQKLWATADALRNPEGPDEYRAANFFWGAERFVGRAV